MGCKIEDRRTGGNDAPHREAQRSENGHCPAFHRGLWSKAREAAHCVARGKTRQPCAVHLIGRGAVRTSDSESQHSAAGCAIELQRATNVASCVETAYTCGLYTVSVALSGGLNGTGDARGNSGP